MGILVAGWIPDRASFSSFLPAILESWERRSLPSAEFRCFIGRGERIRDALQDWAARADPRPDRVILLTFNTDVAEEALPESIRELCENWHASIPFTLIPVFLQIDRVVDIHEALPTSCVEVCHPVMLRSINSAGKRLLKVELESAALELARAFVLGDKTEYAAHKFASQEGSTALALRLLIGSRASLARRNALASHKLFCEHHSDPNKSLGDIRRWKSPEEAKSIPIPPPPKMDLYSPSKFEEWLHEDDPGDDERLMEDGINRTVMDSRPAELFRQFGEMRQKAEISLPQWISDLNDYLRQALTGGVSLTSLEQTLKKRRDQLKENSTSVRCPPMPSRLAADIARRLSAPAAGSRRLARLFQRTRKSWKLVACLFAGGFLAGSLLSGLTAHSWLVFGLKATAWSSFAGGLTLGIGTAVLVRMILLAYRREVARRSFVLLRERLDGELRLMWQNWLRGSAAWLDFHLQRYGAGYCVSVLQERIERVEDYKSALEMFPKDILGQWAFPAFADQCNKLAPEVELTVEAEEEALKFIGSHIFDQFPKWTDRDAIIRAVWCTLDQRIEELTSDGGADERLLNNAEGLFRPIRTFAMAQSRSIEDKPSLRWLVRPPKSQVAAPGGIELSGWQRNDVHLCIALFPIKSDAVKESERSN